MGQTRDEEEEVIPENATITPNKGNQVVAPSQEDFSVSNIDNSCNNLLEGDLPPTNQVVVAPPPPPKKKAIKML